MSDNPTAFPFQARDGTGGDLAPDYGMSLRDWFAGQALTEFSSLISVDKPATLRVVAALCFEMADAMLAERAKAVQP